MSKKTVMKCVSLCLLFLTSIYPNLLFAKERFPHLPRFEERNIAAEKLRAKQVEELARRSRNTPSRKPMTTKWPEPPPACPIVNDTYINSIDMEFKWIPPGTFTMGSSEEDTGFDPVTDLPLKDNMVVHKGFWMAKYEVRQMDWKKIGDRNYKVTVPDRPVGVSYENVRVFLENLNQDEQVFEYRLPSEFEWEYACRATSKQERYGHIDDVAWYVKNCSATQSVMLKKPNKWGLYDMLGNQIEFCADVYLPASAGHPINQRPRKGTGNRVGRGYAYLHKASRIRHGARTWLGNAGHACYGLRVVLEHPY